MDDTHLDEKPKRRWSFRILTVIIGLFFGLVVSEVGLRIVGYSSPEFYKPDEVLGYSLMPDVSGTYSKEGRSFVLINKDGFRDIEHAIEKPPGTVRIAVIGDSYVEALQVEQTESFTSFIRDELTRCPVFQGRSLEILNFGVSGYGTAQELLMLREKVWKYSPDIVMLLVTTNNDITDNSRYFKRIAIPYFTLGKGGLQLDNSFRQNSAFIARNSSLGRLGVGLKNHLRVVQAIGEITLSIKYRYREWKDRPAAKDNAAESSSSSQDFPLAEIGVDNQVYKSPSDENWEYAWKVTEALIEQMKTEVEAAGAEFVVVTGSNGVQVLPDMKARKDTAKLMGVADLYYPDRRIADFCRLHSIKVITLTQILAEYAARENIYLHGFDNNLGYGHWNRNGNRVAGIEIGRQLCEQHSP